MVAEQPSLAVVVNRLDTISQQLASLVAQIDRDRRENARLYVLREVYDTKHEAHSSRIMDLEDENKAQAKAAADTRRQLMFIVLGAFASSLFALIVAVYLGSSGGAS